LRPLWRAAMVAAMTAAGAGGIDEKWLANHATGMAAAADKTAAHRLSGETLARVRREARAHHPCRIKGCKRTAYKGALCRGHWNQVPYSDRLECASAAMDAAHRTAAKYHRRFLRELQARLA
jgi:hypothetical protein